MAVELAQINLADLLAGRTEKHQPRPGSDRGTDPQMAPELTTLCAPAVPFATIRRASRSATFERASRARFSSMSRRRFVGAHGII
jgi:hypothetical protein